MGRGRTNGQKIRNEYTTTRTDYCMYEAWDQMSRCDEMKWTNKIYCLLSVFHPNLDWRLPEPIDTHPELYSMYFSRNILLYSTW